MKPLKLNWLPHIGQSYVKYEKFCSLVSTLHDEIFPVRRFKLSANNIYKPWISTAIMNSIKKKNNLYKLTIQNTSLVVLERYKKYKNKLTMILRNAEKRYYAAKLLEAKDNIGKTWKVLNAIISKNRVKNLVKEVVHEGQHIVDPTSIANRFNEYFVQLGPALAEKIPKNNLIDPCSYLKWLC